MSTRSRPLAAALLSAAALLFPLAAASAADSPGAYPRLRVLTRDDALYLQQQAELDQFRQVAEARGPGDRTYPALSLFEYARRPSDDLFALNARLGLRYDTLATLNGVTDRASFPCSFKRRLPKPRKSYQTLQESVDDFRPGHARPKPEAEENPPADENKEDGEKKEDAEKKKEDA